MILTMIHFMGSSERTVSRAYCQWCQYTEYLFQSDAMHDFKGTTIHLSKSICLFACLRWTSRCICQWLPRIIFIPNWRCSLIENTTRRRAWHQHLQLRWRNTSTSRRVHIWLMVIHIWMDEDIISCSDGTSDSIIIGTPGRSSLVDIFLHEPSR